MPGPDVPNWGSRYSINGRSAGKHALMTAVFNSTTVQTTRPTYVPALRQYSYELHVGPDRPVLTGEILGIHRKYKVYAEH